MDDLQTLAAEVAQRAAELTAGAAQPVELSEAFIRACLEANERGDGVLFATLHGDRFLYNASIKDAGKENPWYVWTGHYWERDEFRAHLAAVEDCALEYESKSLQLAAQINVAAYNDKQHEDAPKVRMAQKLKDRAFKLRSITGMLKTTQAAPIVAPAMACREDDFNQQPWLLPVKNGVIDLRTGALTQGRPGDLLTKALDLEYDPHADYAPFQAFVDEVTDDPEVAGFLKRSLGYAITGHSFEQYIWVFTGPGRNGKGTLFDLVGDIVGPYYHEISRAMLIEQRSEPSPSAASEHKYSLHGKRIIVGSETNRGQKIDGGAIKALTGEDRINCRPNFKSEIVFKPTHTLFLHTNHIPYGLSKDFALRQRLLRVEFPFMYVDDVEEWRKKEPAKAAFFRQKDPHLKEKLRQCKSGILRWLVEGCREWQEVGLRPPESILDAVSDLAKDEDYIGQFMEDCLQGYPDDPDCRVSCTKLHEAFRWWWSQNMDDTQKRVPSIKAVNTAIRERGHLVDKMGGKTWLYRHTLSPLIEDDVAEFCKKNRG